MDLIAIVAAPAPGSPWCKWVCSAHRPCTGPPFDQVELTGEIRSEQVCFLSHDDGIAQTFPGQDFLVNGVLPQGAV